MYVSIGEAAHFLGLSTKTLYRYDKAKTLEPAYRTAGGHRRYSLRSLQAFCGEPVKSATTAAIYARVSAAKQKADLEHQIDYLERVATSQGYSQVVVYRDIASGVKDTRKGLLRMITDAYKGKFDAVYIAHADRLARFGTEILQHIFGLLQIPIRRVGETPIEESATTKFIEDILAILTSYAGRLHRLRRDSYTRPS